MDIEIEDAVALAATAAFVVIACGWVVARASRPHAERAWSALVVVPATFVWAFLRLAVALAEGWMRLALPVGATCILGGTAILLAGEGAGAGVVAAGALCLLLWFAAVLVSQLRPD